jgi:carotenoid 1,2-hydratase
MYLISDPSKDHRHPKTTTGAYEWWYFDALDVDSNFGIVLIFYDGLLFSPDYHEAQVKGLNGTADKHPGLSISLYEGRDTIYYALKSFSPDKAFFSDSSCDLSIGKNTVSSSIKNSELVYEIGINDQLPNGLHLVGKLKFYSKHVPAGIASENVEAHHQWNLVQAKASVTAELHLVTPTNEIRNIEFEGTGYHDHNLGFRPIEGDFDQWYWGRVHVNEGTLVWYIMYKEDDIQQVAWLINESDGTYTPVDFIRMKSPARTTILGLKVFDQLEVGIQGQR